MTTRRLLAALVLLLCTPTLGRAQQAPIPLYPNQPPSTVEPELLAPLAPGPASPAPVPPVPPPPVAPAMPLAAQPSPAHPQPPPIGASLSPPSERVFCNQSVRVQLAATSVPARYQPFIGGFSDASWTPQLCAALVVENVTADGTATIVYVFGPMGSSNPAAGGVLHGTGIVRDGELEFQNSDGSQFAFRPLYSDLNGRLTTPKGQTYQSVFERTP